eukprot:15434952-Alexandrium_andersonii.AAC.1
MPTTPFTAAELLRTMQGIPADSIFHSTFGGGAAAAPLPKTPAASAPVPATPVPGVASSPAASASVNVPGMAGSPATSQQQDRW